MQDIGIITPIIGSPLHICHLTVGGFLIGVNTVFHSIVQPKPFDGLLSFSFNLVRFNEIRSLTEAFKNPLIQLIIDINFSFCWYNRILKSISHFREKQDFYQLMIKCLISKMFLIYFILFYLLYVIVKPVLI